MEKKTTAIGLRITPGKSAIILAMNDLQREGNRDSRYFLYSKNV